MLLKKRLFNQGAVAAAAAWGIEENYVCPLCGVVFTRFALEDGGLSLEHVPPKAAGGRSIILTCRPCNNRAGHTVDAAASSRSKVQQFVESMLGTRQGYAG